MGRHSKKTNRKYYGRHWVVTPKRNLKAVRRTAIAFALTMSMALYPAVVGDGTGRFPLLEDALPALKPRSATAGEVIPESSEDDNDGRDAGVDVDLPGDE